MSYNQKNDHTIKPHADEKLGDRLDACKDGGKRHENESLNENDEKSSKEIFFLGAESDESDEDGSSSETEISILEQAEGIYYGSTPPRHARRMKCKLTKSGKKDAKLHNSPHSGGVREKQKTAHHHKRDYLRKISYEDRFSEDVHSQHKLYPRRTPSICVETLDRYRSIKSVPALLDKHHQISSKPKPRDSIIKSISYGSVMEGQNCPSNRLHFMKTFQLLVKLGDRHGRRDSRRGSDFYFAPDVPDPEVCQIQFDQLLWFELQARRSGRKITEQDTYLLAERKKVDDILDKVMHFHFPTELEQYEAAHGNQPSFHSTPVKVANDENIGTTSPAHQEHTPINTAAAHSTNLPFSPHDVDHFCSTIDDHFTGSIQRKAMHIIIMLLKEVEDSNALYPSSKALAQSHPNYLNQNFIRNYETLNVWLNICKELYHKLQVVASLVDVDAEDNQTWEDWFDHGLGMYESLAASCLFVCLFFVCLFIMLLNLYLVVPCQILIRILFTCYLCSWFWYAFDIKLKHPPAMAC